MANIEQFTSEEEALKYLRGLDKVVMPKLFTYWHHATYRNPTNTPMDRKNVWETLPEDKFVVTGIDGFSLKSRREILKEVSENQPSYIRYSGSPDPRAKILNIKVIVPKVRLSEDERKKLKMSEEEYTYNEHRERGVGSGNPGHPRVESKKEVYIIGSMDHDQQSGQKVDTLIAVRKEDIIRYATSVQEEVNNIKSNNGTLEDTPVINPKNLDEVSEINNKRETVILGDNLGIDFIKAMNQQKEQGQTKDNEGDKKQINIDELEQQVDKVMSGLESQYGESTQMTTKATIEDERKNQPLTVKSVYGSENTSNGRVRYTRHYRASYQEMDTNAAKKQCEGLKDKILDNAKILSESGPQNNRVTYMLRDLVDLKQMIPVLDEMQQRTTDLQYFEKYCRLPDDKPRFFDERLSVSEDVEVEKKGIFTTKKETVRQQRKKNPSELQNSLDEDLQIIKYRLLRKEITQEEHDRCAESIQRLYGKEIEMMNQKGATEEMNASENETNDNGVQENNNVDSPKNEPASITKASLQTKPFEENIANHPEGIIKASQKLVEQEPSFCGKLLGKIKRAVSNIFGFVNSRSKSNQPQERVNQQQQEAVNQELINQQNQRTMGDQ